MNLSEHSALTLLSHYPVISYPAALQKVLHGKFRTLGKRNADNELEIFLCTPSGLPLAIVDFEIAGSEVCR